MKGKNNRFKKGESVRIIGSARNQLGIVQSTTDTICYVLVELPYMELIKHDRFKFGNKQ